MRRSRARLEEVIWVVSEEEEEGIELYVRSEGRVGIRTVAWVAVCTKLRGLATWVVDTKKQDDGWP